MFPIPESLFDTVIYVYPSVAAAERGENSGACGFVYSVPGRDSRSLRHYFAVTNQHVAIHAGAIRMKRVDGTPCIIKLGGDDWIAHERGDDVAVAHIPRERLRGVRCNGLRDVHLLERLNVVGVPESQRTFNHNLWTGAPCVLLSRIVEQQRQPSNSPVARFGTVSSVALDSFFVPEAARSQESLVVEVRSLSGYSGSPVFTIGALPSLLGINWGHLKTKQPLFRTGDSGQPLASGEFVWSNIGQAVVVPGWKLKELLDSPRVMEIRQTANALDAASGSARNMTYSNQVGWTPDDAQ